MTILLTPVPVPELEPAGTAVRAPGRPNLLRRIATPAAISPALK